MCCCYIPSTHYEIFGGFMNVSVVLWLLSALAFRQWLLLQRYLQTATLRCDNNFSSSTKNNNNNLSFNVIMPVLSHASSLNWVRSLDTNTVIVLHQTESKQRGQTRTTEREVIITIYRQRWMECGKDMHLMTK